MPKSGSINFNGTLPWLRRSRIRPQVQSYLCSCYRTKHFFTFKWNRFSEVIFLTAWVVSQERRWGRPHNTMTLRIFFWQGIKFSLFFISQQYQPSFLRAVQRSKKTESSCSAFCKTSCCNQNKNAPQRSSFLFTAIPFYLFAFFLSSFFFFVAQNGLILSNKQLICSSKQIRTGEPN